VLDVADRRETPGSAELAERLRRALPGGDTRSSTFYEPYPIAFERGEGCRVWDVDGNEYVDFLNNFTSLVHGHAHPQIVEAVALQAARGTAFPAPNVAQAELAERIVERVPSIELLRYTNSGSEANMLAIRLARAYTGRERIVKADGGYHGSWEQLPLAGSPATGSHDGTPQAVLDLIHWCEFNDVESLRAAVEEAGDRLAAIVLEPVQLVGGVIAGTPEFLRAARELADEAGALLVLDEVVTLRLAPGGYQSVLGVRPDLTTLGKIIGGGLPVGATGGRREVLEAADPRRPGHVGHSGTFNGNPLTSVAGCVSLDLLDAAAIERLNGLGERFASGLRGVLEAHGVEASVTSCGSLVQIHLETEGPVRTFGDTNPGSALLARLHRAALDEGVFFAGRGLLNLSTAMDDAVIDRALDALGRAATTLQPALERV